METEEEVARSVYAACGGSKNIESNSICMTRLRLEVSDTSLCNTSEIEKLHGVLAVNVKNKKKIEIVFGPAIIDEIGKAFSELSNKELNRKTAKSIVRLTSLGVENVDVDNDLTHVKEPIPASRKASYAAQRRAYNFENAPESEESETHEDLDKLRAILDSTDKIDTSAVLSESTYELDNNKISKVLYIINGPNINMIKSDSANESYQTICSVCEKEGPSYGFDDVRCFQSNHEGAIIDEIQSAYQFASAIIINAGAYAYTSLAIPDAIRSVEIPCVQVETILYPPHRGKKKYSKLDAVCIDKITGSGSSAYTYAMDILSKHLEIS